MQDLGFMRTRAIAVAISLGMLGATDARAEDAPAAPASPPPLGGVIPALDAVDQTANRVKDWVGQYGITLGMGVSASYQYGFTKPANNKLSLRLLDKDHDRFSVDLFQMTLKKDATNPGDWGFQVQGITGRYSRRYKSDWDGSGVLGDNDFEEKELEVQQAYLAYNVPIGNGVQLKLGKFNTLVGSEVNEPWLNPTYSKQLIYNNAQPATHTGGLASYAFNSVVSLTVGGVTGWDVVGDNNKGTSFIGQIGLTPDPMASFYIGALYGPEQAGKSAPDRMLFDIVSILKPIDGLAIITNFDYGNEEHATAGGNVSNFWGISNTFAYDITPRLNAAFRAEWFDDQDGTRTGLKQGVWETTLDLKFKLTDYMYVRGEYRHDESSRRQAFVHKTAGSLPGQDTLAWELGYAF